MSRLLLRGNRARVVIACPLVAALALAIVGANERIDREQMR